MKKHYILLMRWNATPPGSEEVLWIVFRQPIQASAGQIKAYTDLYADNAQPVQK